MENPIEEEPQLLTAQSTYQLLIGVNNTFRNSFLTSTRSLIFSETSAVSWQYSQYTYRSLFCSRFFNTLFYSSYLITASITQFIFPETPIYSKTPFVMHPVFSRGGWLISVVFCLFLTLTSFLHNSQVISLFCNDLTYKTVPIYIFLSVYMISREQFTSGYGFLFDIFCLIIVLCLCIHIYLKIRYIDDGRYQVTWKEYLGIQVNFSVLLPWSFIHLVSCSLLAAYKYDELYDSYILKLTRDDWNILVLSIIFFLSVMGLSVYKDVFFGGTFAYCCFGIFYMQKEMKDNGNEAHSGFVMMLSFVFAISICCFIVVTLGFYCRTVCFCVRRPVWERDFDVE